jgi:uncharacterized membrane protein YeaQ/YmgE (transglycosylase-associated protein family)
VQATILSIGTRKVRSAGRASGSIEITLPPELAALEGVDCHVVLRDGARPEIVLEPDLTPAVAVFTRAWTRLRSLLRLAGDIGEFPAQECELTLLPGQRLNGRPLLIYSHAWQVSLLGKCLPATPAANRFAAVAGLLAPLATVAGHRLGLVGTMAAAFGAAVGSLTAPAFGSESFESGAARQIWYEVCGAAAALDILTTARPEELAQQALQRIVSQFRAWQEQPDRHAIAHAQWLAGPDFQRLRDQRS